VCRSSVKQSLSLSLVNTLRFVQEDFFPSSNNSHANVGFGRFMFVARRDVRPFELGNSNDSAIEVQHRPGYDQVVPITRITPSTLLSSKRGTKKTTITSEFN
jgi:hypothetical protein